jgi:hypothetical protein
VERREPNAGRIVAGLLFIGIGIAYLVAEVGDVDVNPRWVWPALLIGLGIAGLVRSRPRRDDSRHGADA